MFFPTKMRISFLFHNKNSVLFTFNVKLIVALTDNSRNMTKFNKKRRLLLEPSSKNRFLMCKAVCSHRALHVVMVAGMYQAPVCILKLHTYSYCGSKGLILSL